MTASVFAFPSRKSGPQPWTNDELAELYRVVEMLGRAGLAVVTDMGMSDEGDPWFVFCRSDSGDVIAHFARIGGQFVAASIAVDETYRGANFRQIVERMVESQPLILPSPPGGTRLLMHPMVILTAFIATALAHSERMMSSDFLRSVDAQWDHGPAAQDGSQDVKHAKGSWLGSLQAIFKAPLADHKIDHDLFHKEGQALSLASLIAIAMTALQPIIEKMSIIAHAVADELSGDGHLSPVGQGGHAAQASQEIPVIDLDGGRSSGSATASVTGDYADQPQHKLPIDSGADAQKSLIDATVNHVASVPVVKVAIADDSQHLPVASAAQSPSDNYGNSNGAYLINLQKLAAAATTVPDPSAPSHTDSGAASWVIAVQDVNPQALQVLNIHLTPSETDAAKNAASDSTTAAAPPSGPAGGESAVTTGGASAAPVVSSTSLPAGPQVIDVANTDGIAIINAISNFATSGAHVTTQPVTESASLEQQLAPYFGTSSSLKVILFQSTSATSEVFAFSPGVVFVEESLISPTANFTNHGGTLTLDNSGGGTFTLVGVATIGQHVV